MSATAARNRVGGRAIRGAAPFSGPGRASQFPYAWCCVIPHPLRSSLPAQHPQPWFHGQTVPHFGNLDAIVRAPAEFVYELNRRPSIGEDTDRSH